MKTDYIADQVSAILAMQELGTERQVAEYTKAIKNILGVEPDAVFGKNYVLVYSVYCLDGRIEIDRSKENIVRFVNSAKGRMFNPHPAVSMIEKLLPTAIEKKNKIIEKLDSLKKDLAFDLNYEFFGDTHGIHGERMYIDFRLNGYYFTFTLED